MVLHNTYQQRGGEDAVVEHEAELLKAAGLRVTVKTISNDRIQSVSAKIDTVFKSKGDWGLARDIVAEAQSQRAQLVHIHNFWPLVTPATHIALAQAGIAVVQTLHNYRLLCANGMLLRDGMVCEDCITGSRGNAIRHRCYRGSIAGTAAALAMQEASIHNPTWVNSVSKFIALTDFAKRKFVAQGLPESKIVIKGNSLADPIEGGVRETNRDGFLFVGRIAEGKGVELLTEAARQFPDSSFTIVGDGPLKQRLEEDAPDNVVFAGEISRADVFAAMAKARWLVFPSTWYEGFPISLVEALAHGLPAIVPRIGGLSDIIGDGAAGLLFEPGDLRSLVKQIERAADPALSDQKGRGARAQYENAFNPDADRDALLEVYSHAVEDAALMEQR